ncbi:hypothetical protein MBLNU13_g06919t1 [Cladosporium sp. NU13]
MLANTSNPQPRRRSAALEVMLSSLETAGDLLSGSECSSLAASPIDQSTFTLNPQFSKQHQRRNEKSRLGPSPPKPIDIVLDLLDHMSEPPAAKGLVAVDANVEWCSGMVLGAHKKEAPQEAQGHLDGLLSICSSCEIQIDSIFACGEDVAAFGHFAYSYGPTSSPRNVNFSIWACVDVAREKIVELRWLDQFVRAEGGNTDRL